MNESRTLVREVVVAGPDGTAVKVLERADVTIEWPDETVNEQTAGAYAIYVGDWRLLPKEARDAS